MRHPSISGTTDGATIECARAVAASAEAGATVDIWWSFRYVIMDFFAF